MKKNSSAVLLLKAFAFATMASTAVAAMRPPDVMGVENPQIVSQWKGRNVVFFGDSITDKAHIGTIANYWNYLTKILGINAYVYGVNGSSMGGVMKQIQKFCFTIGDGDPAIDAFVIFAGTNDFNGGVPLGEWYEEKMEKVNKNGETVSLKHRTKREDNTFRGSINQVLGYMKRTFPRQQIILITPLHRSFAQFGPTNVQPDESYANTAGLYIDDYVRAVREAGSVWSVPVIDLFALSGLYPSDSEYAIYFHNEKTDMLHPNHHGHLRMAETMAYQMLGLPAGFWVKQR